MRAATFSHPADRHFVAGALFMGVLLALSLAALATDPRLLDGWNVWTKPVKFALSLALHLGTLAFFAGRLSPAFRAGPTLRIAAPAVLFCVLGEMVYLMVQAGQQAHSHFNVATPFHAAMYIAMGVAAFILTSGAAVVGVLIRRDRAARLSPGLRAGAILGLVGGTVLTVVVAGYMSGIGSHFVGEPGAGAAALPLLGWSLSVGDLRPAHFLALHMMQGLPLIGWLLDRRAPAEAVRGVRIAAVVWAIVTFGVFARALAGLPLVAV
jgi:hypothetical protein